MMKKRIMAIIMIFAIIISCTACNVDKALEDDVSTTGSYYVDEEGNKLKYANNGEVIEKTPANPTSDEENNTDVVE